MIKPGGHGFQPGPRGQFNDLFGPGIGGDVDILDRLIQQRIAHRAADQKGAMPVRADRLQHRLQRRIVKDMRGQDGHAGNLRASSSNIRAVAPQR